MFLSLCKEVAVVFPVFLPYLLFCKVTARTSLCTVPGNESSVDTFVEAYFSFDLSYFDSF